MTTPISDPEVQAFIDRTEALYPADSNTGGIEDNRRLYDAMCQAFHAGRPDGVTVTDETIGAVPIRRYRPSAPAGTTVALYFHGGGYSVGGLDSHDDVCAELCAQTGLELVAVDYRLAPEFRYPSQLDDAETVWRAEASNRPGIVVGDSAGGNIAAALCFRMRRLNGPMPVGQVLIYPGLGGDLSLPSYTENALAPMLRTEDLAPYRAFYTGGNESLIIGNPEASPLQADDYTGLAPAFVVTGDIDPVRDDGKEYVKRLTEAGVDAVYRNEEQLVHGYLRARHMSRRAAESFAEIARRIRGFASL